MHVKTIVYLTTLAIGALFLSSLASGDPSPAVVGQWVTPAGDSLIEIEGRQTLTVTLLAIRGDEPTLDTENPDPARRERPLADLRLGTGFELDGETWTGGSLYDPGSGNTYKARFRALGPDRLEVRGYVGLPAFGRTEVWTRRALFRQQIEAMLAAGGPR